MVMLAVSGSIDARGGMGPGKLRLAVRLSLISNINFVKGSWKVIVLTSGEKMKT
jgi:hypothetical protein